MTTDKEPLPEGLRRIREEASRDMAATQRAEALRTAWVSHAKAVRARVPAAHIENGGEALFLNRLSPGCRACKNGEWDCVFVTMACNLDCEFCWRPDMPGPSHLGSALSAGRDGLPAQYARTRVSGVSFSGGDPFMAPADLFDWVSWFASRYPNLYYWVYTNGVLAGDDHVARLADLGVNEIRFNMAATNYTDANVMANLAAAARRLPAVTVEIPVIPDHAGRLLDALERWCEAGVTFLNLHELVYEPGTNSARMAGTRQAGSLGDGHAFEYNPASRALTLDIMEKVHAGRLPLGVNDCSLCSKARQLRGRRHLLAPLLCAPHERFRGEDELESCCAWRGEDEVIFHPDQLEEMRRRHPEHHFARLVRQVPLGWNAAGRWIRFDPL